jgi:hypothetical protein
MGSNFSTTHINTTFVAFIFSLLVVSVFSRQTNSEYIQTLTQHYFIHIKPTHIFLVFLELYFYF